MKSLYWRPRKISRAALAIIAVGSLISLAIVERFPLPEYQMWYAEKLAAAQTAGDAMEVIRRERLSRGHQFDPQFDPAMSGMIGEPESLTTSNSGNLESKQTSVNPNFAAVVVELLKQAGVEAGDSVAVGYTGSFPAMNLCVLAALQTLNCRPVIIASATGSQYGANRPDLLWIDMERVLVDSGVIAHRSQAASLGGSEDQALRMSPEARQSIRHAIERNGLPCIDATSYEDSLDARMSLYETLSGGAPITAYINVGSGSVSVGRSRGMKYYSPGLNLTPPPGATQIDSVMSRFMRAEVPVIHLVEMKQLAREHGLPIAPTRTPKPGESPVHVQYRGNRPLAAIAAGFVLVSIYLVILRGTGSSPRWHWRRRGEKPPSRCGQKSNPHLELMV